jgi:hypothetical protein
VEGERAARALAEHLRDRLSDGTAVHTVGFDNTGARCWRGEAPAPAGAAG